VTWFEVEQGALLHVTNSYVDRHGRVVVEGPRYDRASWESSWKWWIGAPGYGTSPDAGSTLHRWLLDPATGKAGDEPLDDLVTEFPSINDALTGAANRYSYAIAFPGAGLSGYHTIKFDTVTGRRQLLSHGEHRMPGEAVFVPAEGGTDEDDGYLLTIVSDLKANASHLLVLDATNIGNDPIAAVELPRRVPAGIHGHWIEDNK
jgi:carotenoid cleavage dioxygenase